MDYLPNLSVCEKCKFCHRNTNGEMVCNVPLASPIEIVIAGKPFKTCNVHRTLSLDRTIPSECPVKEQHNPAP